MFVDIFESDDPGEYTDEEDERTVADEETSMKVEGESIGGQMTKTRRRRTAFTSEQLLELEKEFHSKKYLSLSERSQIASSLRLSEVRKEGKRRREHFNSPPEGADKDLVPEQEGQVEEGEGRHISWVQEWTGG